MCTYEQTPERVPMNLRVQEIGCLMGALSNLWVGDKIGRRKTIVLGGCIMIVGAILQTASINYAMLVVARIITGFGNGINVCLGVSRISTFSNLFKQTSTVPSYHCECSPAAKRGSNIMIEGSLITLGVMISYVSALFVERRCQVNRSTRYVCHMFV